VRVVACGGLLLSGRAFTARLVECTFIAIGIVCMLAISTLRQDAVSGTDAAVGQGIFAVYEWTFRIGPGVFAGIGTA
jgi:hypothetical protein